jgi:hypothetical protein
LDRIVDQEQVRQWAANWKRVGPILEKIRYDELRAMTEEESATSLNMLADFALNLPDQKARTTSGFVEQQRRFMKIRKP